MNTQGIALLGTPVSSANRGVLALGASLINLCAAKAGVTLLLSHKDSLPVSFRVNDVSCLVPVVNCRLSPTSHASQHLAWILSASLLYRLIPLASVRRALRRSTPWIDAIERVDFAGDIRGGDSFSDIYGLKRFLLGFLMAWTVVLVKGSMVQLPQTYGPYKTGVARWLARYLLERSSVIIARDRDSQQVAQRLIGPGKKVLLSPDVAFCLDPIVPEKLVLDPPHASKSIPLPLSSPQFPKPVGLNISGLMFNGGYSRKNMFGLKLDYASLQPELLKALLLEQAGELWLVPHTYGAADSVQSDPEACRRVRAALPEVSRQRVRIVAGEYDCHEIKGVIGHCDFFIGSRMHACIAALSQGIPCVGIAYSMKFRGVFETVGMEDWVIDGRTATNEEAVKRVIELYRQRDTAREPLRRRAADARERLQDVFRNIFASARPPV